MKTFSMLENRVSFSLHPSSPRNIHKFDEEKDTGTTRHFCLVMSDFVGGFIYISY